MKKTPVSVNFVTDVTIHDALRETAEAEARSVSSLIRLIIRDWYAQRKPPRRLRSERTEAA
jgi:hypothetical protein